MPQRRQPPLIQRDDKGLVPLDCPKTALPPPGAIVAVSGRHPDPLTLGPLRSAPSPH